MWRRAGGANPRRHPMLAFCLQPCHVPSLLLLVATASHHPPHVADTPPDANLRGGIASSSMPACAIRRPAPGAGQQARAETAAPGDKGGGRECARGRRGNKHICSGEARPAAACGPTPEIGCRRRCRRHVPALSHCNSHPRPTATARLATRCGSAARPRRRQRPLRCLVAPPPCACCRRAAALPKPTERPHHPPSSAGPLQAQVPHRRDGCVLPPDAAPPVPGGCADRIPAHQGAAAGRRGGGAGARGGLPAGAAPGQPSGRPGSCRRDAQPRIAFQGSRLPVAGARHAALPSSTSCRIPWSTPRPQPPTHDKHPPTTPPRTTRRPRRLGTRPPQPPAPPTWCCTGAWLR